VKPLLVGEANPYSEDPADALLPYPDGSAGWRLARMLGWGRAQYLRSFDRTNIFAGPRDRWSLPEARGRAQAILEGRSDGDIILLGRRVCDAFERSEHEFWMRIGRFVTLPHPSGRSRTWNDPEAIGRLRRMLDPYRSPR